METKQVIIQNKDEERQFLKEATKRKFVWINGGEDAISYIPSENVFFDGFPYVIEIENGEIGILILTEPLPLTVKQFLESK